jgi:hypothetical protein
MSNTGRSLKSNFQNIIDASGVLSPCLWNILDHEKGMKSEIDLREERHKKGRIFLPF